jgi:uncharacterized protein YggU (UPF0235/DUF167 family)
MARIRLEKGCWADLAVPGARLAVRVTPGARQEGAQRDGAALAIAVSEPPDEGRANAAVRAALARALGVAPSRLELVAGATSRDKVFRLTE